MITSDIVNGLFEVFGSVAVAFSCYRLFKDKQVKGISLITTLFFTSWGFWNLFYYPHLGQVMSTLGAGGVCAMNTLWCVLIVKYRGR